MAISLTNKKNTKIVNFDDDVVALIHHGSNTCTINQRARKAYISLCGYDTVTTRGKINKFLAKYDAALQLCRSDGNTYIRNWQSGAIIASDIGSKDTFNLAY